MFVINLCTLAAPITVPQPRASRLTRYTFFLSHTWVDDRRQYRLHMGYFNTAAEADKWLATLKRVYPDAHVGEAPETQPDLLTSTQRVRVLQIGQIGELPQDFQSGRESYSRMSETPSRLRETPVRARAAPGPVTPIQPARQHTNASLERTLEELRTSEFDMGSESDDLNATGVRHLRFEIEKGKPAVQPAPKAGVRTRR